MDTTAVSSLNPILGAVTPSKTAVGNAINPPSGPDFDGQEVQTQTERIATETRVGRALQIFRQEISDTAQVRPGAEDAYQSVLSSKDVATAALNVARRSVARDADVSNLALLQFRQRVQSAASVARDTVGGDPDIGRLDSALGRIESGLRSLDDEASRNVESTASVLSVDSRERQRSTIRIRTQEGDVVRLDLSSRSRVRGQDVAVTDASGSSSKTDVSVSSQSQLRLRVSGDLSESEYAAIQSVFAQAESIAGEFFGGDLAAAFSQASDLNFDSEQLARVNLRFRSQQVVRTSYAETVTRSSTPEPVAQVGTGNAAQSPSVAREPVAVPVQAPSYVRPVVSEPVRAPVAEPATDSARPSSTKSTTTVQVAERQSLTAGSTNAPAATDAAGIDLTSDDFLRFFDLLGDFLRSVADGFDRLAESIGAELDSAQAVAASDSGGVVAGDAEYFTYHFSQAFKLEIFKSVLDVSAQNETQSEAATLAAGLIDGLSAPEVTETEQA